MVEVDRSACWYYDNENDFIKEFLFDESNITSCTIFYIDESNIPETFFIRQLQGEGLTVTVDSMEENTDGVSNVVW